MIEWLEQLVYEERLRKLILFILEKRRFGEDLVSPYRCLKGEYNEDKVGLFSVTSSDMTRGNGNEIKRFCLNLMKQIFLCVGKNTETGCSERLCIICSLRFNWYALVTSWARMLGKITSGGLSNFNYSLILSVQSQTETFTKVTSVVPVIYISFSLKIILISSTVLHDKKWIITQNSKYLQFRTLLRKICDALHCYLFIRTNKAINPCGLNEA